MKIQLYIVEKVVNTGFCTKSSDCIIVTDIHWRARWMGQPTPYHSQFLLPSCGCSWLLPCFWGIQYPHPPAAPGQLCLLATPAVPFLMSLSLQMTWTGLCRVRTISPGSLLVRSSPWRVYQLTPRPGERTGRRDLLCLPPEYLSSPSTSITAASTWILASDLFCPEHVEASEPPVLALVF